MDFAIRHVLELALIGVSAPLQMHVAWRLRNHPRVPRALLVGASALLLAWMAFALCLDAVRVHTQFPTWVYPVFRGTYLAWMMIVIGGFVLHLCFRAIFKQWAAHSPQRRQFLHATYAAPAAALGYGAFIERKNFQLREVDIPIAKLPKELHGLRIAQVTDVHLGDFLSERQLAHVIGMANETKPHLAIMTGDLITKRGDPLDECLRQLRRLKADAGVLGCLGNHEIYARAEDYVAENAARLGMDFLRRRSRRLVFNGKAIHFTGVDYQAKRFGPYLQSMEQLVAPGEINVLLSHNPDVFRVAPEKGFDLTLAGHTHGGQIAVEYLNPVLNAASFVTPYVAGYYHERGASLYVSRGVGTIGVPARIGVPPEITLIRLCAI